jgi:hypothetical protein
VWLPAKRLLSNITSRASATRSMVERRRRSHGSGMGVLTPMPCIPATASPWAPAFHPGISPSDGSLECHVID